MSLITTNYAKNEHQEYSALPTGNYEMIIKSAQEKATPNGAESLQIDLVVRNDLDAVPALAKTNAKYHNRHVFMDNWKRKATHQYDLDSFQYILEAVQIPEGTPINNIQDLVNALANKPAKVYVKNTKDNYQGEEREVNQVAPWNFNKSDYPQVQHTWKDQSNGENPFANNQATSEPQINDDDLPF